MFTKNDSNFSFFFFNILERIVNEIIAHSFILNTTQSNASLKYNNSTGFESGLQEKLFR